MVATPHSAHDVTLALMLLAYASLVVALSALGLRFDYVYHDRFMAGRVTLVAVCTVVLILFGLDTLRVSRSDAAEVSFPASETGAVE